MAFIDGPEEVAAGSRQRRYRLDVSIAKNQSCGRGNSAGDRQRAVDLLEAAADDRSIAITWIKVSPWLAPLRGEARLEARLDRIRLRARSS